MSRILFVFIALAVCAGLLYTGFRIGRGKADNMPTGGDTLRLRLEAQNAGLRAVNDSLLLVTVGLRDIVDARTGRDVALQQEINRLTRALPAITERLQKIDQQYEQTIRRSRNFSVAQLEQYIRTEADRLRRSGNGE